MSKPLVGISSCLTGQKVRYDGEHKYNRLIMEQLATQVTLLPICPEAAIGMGIPRPPIEVVQTPQGLRTLGRDTPLDATEPLIHFAQTITQTHTQLCGYIFQSRSPSCGFNTTPIHNEQRQPVALGSGLYAQTLTENLPLLPVVNDTDLTTPEDCERFLQAVWHYYSK